MDLPAEDEAAVARRKAIQDIMKDPSLSQPEKQQQIQALMAGKGSPKPNGQENMGVNANPGRSELNSFEQDVVAKQKGRSTAASRPGAIPVASNTGDGGDNESGLSTLERDVMAKQRGRNLVSGAQAGGHGELSQLERDVQAKQRARPTGPSVPGVQSSVGRGELSQLERDVQAKQRARPSGVSTPGAQAAGQGELSQMERDIQAKQRARPTGGSIPGPQAAGHGELSQLERDVQAKQLAFGGRAASNIPGAYQAASNAATPASGLSQLEQDVQAKQKARPVGANGPSPPGGLSQLESDVAAKQRAFRPATTPVNPGAHNAAGQSELSQLESDVTAKNRARPAVAASAPGAQAASGGGRSELSSFENDVMAKNRARGDKATAATSPTLSSLEQDVMAKNQARAPPSASAGYSSGARELSSLEQDVAAKNRARPSSLMADNTFTVGAMSGRNDLYALENSISQKSSFGGMGPPPSAERSPLFDNVAASSGGPMHEIFQLDERIAHKSSPPSPLQLQSPRESARQAPRHMDYDETRYEDTRHEDTIYDETRVENPFRPDSSYENPYESEEYSKHMGFDGKGGYPEDGIERARDDKTGYAGEERPPGGEVGIVTPAGDVEYGEVELAVATAIEEDDENTFIPAAVQYDPDAKPPMYKNRRFRLYGMAGVFFLIAVVVVAIVITQVADNGPSGPTMAPTSYRESLGTSIEQQISGIFGNDYFNDTTSTQYKALQWLVNEDPFEIQPNAENLIQRYILAYFYLETSAEGGWISCGKPEGNEADNCYYMFLLDTYQDPWRYEELYWTRWLSGAHECDWAGITCHSDKVTDINLDGYQLTGTFPLELTKLDYLRDISLTHNKLRGTLPRELARMRHLTDIELQRNLFTGTIPDEWFDAKNLIHVNFATNQITGTVPTEFGLLTDLQRMFIQNNQLTGSLPKEIFQMTSLKWVFIGNNKFGGTIPTEVGQLTNLEYLYGEGNPFTGTLPTEMGRLTEMRELDLHDSLLSGTIPEEIYIGMWEMADLFDFSDCNLEGTISPLLKDMRSLEWIYLPNNLLTGTIPEELSEMPVIRRLHVQGNQLTGSIPMDFCVNRADLLDSVIADCAATSSGDIPVYCPPGCCTECCNQDTGVCLDATN